MVVYILLLNTYVKNSYKKSARIAEISTKVTMGTTFYVHPVCENNKLRITATVFRSQRCYVLSYGIGL